MPKDPTDFMADGGPNPSSFLVSHGWTLLLPLAGMIPLLLSIVANRESKISEAVTSPPAAIEESDLPLATFSELDAAEDEAVLPEQVEVAPKSKTEPGQAVHAILASVAPVVAEASRGGGAVAVQSEPESAETEVIPTKIAKLASAPELVAEKKSESEALPIPVSTPIKPKTVPLHLLERGTHYQVEPGDTLSEIAQDFGVSVKSIAQANRLNSADKLLAGSVLVIPQVDPSSKRPVKDRSENSRIAERRLRKVPLGPPARVETEPREEQSTGRDGLVLGPPAPAPYPPGYSSIDWSRPAKPLVEEQAKPEGVGRGRLPGVVPGPTEPLKPVRNLPRGHIYYVIQPQDSLRSIAQAHGTDVDTLLDINDLRGVNTGHTIIVPAYRMIPGQENPEPRQRFAEPVTGSHDLVRDGPVLLFKNSPE